MVLRPRARWLLALLLPLVVSCSHAPPQLIQVFNQVNRVYDPSTHGWSFRLSVFVQAASPDGTKVFDRLHLIHDGQGLYFTLAQGQWTVVERQGEFWVGSNNLSFPDGKVPTGEWRVLLVTRSGQKVTGSFVVPPLPPWTPDAAASPVTVREDPSVPGRVAVSGWGEDLLVWARDDHGTLLARVKAVGDTVQVPAGTQTFSLYSYDKNRGEGIEAGPFSLKAPSKPADR